MGTRYYVTTEVGAALQWEHREDGWNCPDRSCEDCPTTWMEVVGFIQRRNYQRRLPGEIAPPLAGEVSVDHPEVPF